jgi:glycerol-3-phosphate O-acyltransferase
VSSTTSDGGAVDRTGGPLEPPGRAEAEAIRYGSAMLRRFGWFYWLLGLGRALGRLRLEEHSAEQVRVAAARGPVVYVLPRRSVMDHLALNTVLNQRRLPLSVWANGVTSFWWQPVADAWRDVARRVRERLDRGPTPDPIGSGWLSRTVARGAPVTVFLQDGPMRELLSLEDPEDPLRAILEAQKRSDRPIQLLPALVVWNRAPEQQDAFSAFISGLSQAPGFLTQLWNALFRSHEAFVQIGEPLDLRELVERVEEPKRPKAVRTVLRRWLHRESTVVRGPRLLPHRVMKRIVLDNPPMRELAKREADAAGKSYERVRAQMERDFDRMAANFRWWVIRVLDVVLKPLWTRIYAGVDVRPEDLERIRTAMRKGTAILVPSHKSHFDYLLLSWVFYAHDLIVPHVVAGMNLAIWPLSIVLRGAGGFFVKRSFTGDRVFPAVFSRYLRELVRQRYPIEFFIEGGRTRSGKLLPPKLGVLGMVFEAAELRRRGDEVTILPIALAYEQVAEEQAYARELGGEKKKAESMGDLVKARSVLRRRYGRVYMRVGEPILCSPLVDPEGTTPGWHERQRQDQKEALQRVGERVIHRIGQVTVVLPTSLVALGLLAHHRRGIEHAELIERIERFRAFLQRAGALEAASLTYASQAIHEALARFLRQKLVESIDAPGKSVWAAIPDKRISLDFHKNQVLHFFAPAMYATAAIRALPDAPFRRDDVVDGFLFLAWLLRREFVLDPDRPASQQLDDGLEALVAHGALERTEDGFRVADPARMGEIHGLFRSILESWVHVLRNVPALVEAGIDENDLPAELQKRGLPADGTVTRPEALSLVTLQNAAGTLKEERGLSEPEKLLARLLPMVE